MGYRPNIIAEPKSYGEEIGVFNYNTDEFETLLEELFEVEYFTPDNQESLYEIENSEVEKLKTFEFDNEKVAEIAKDWDKSESYVMELATSLKNSLIGALDTNYSKELGYVAIEWL